MTLELQRVMERRNSSGPLVMETLEPFAPGTYCTHRSWGTGRIVEWHLDIGYIIVDFEDKRGHAMQIQYATQTLQPLCHDDLRVRIFQDVVTVRAEAESFPVEFVRSLLQANGGKMVVNYLTSTLVPKVFDAASFKKWWDTLKKKLKSDSHFHFPSKKTEPIELRKLPPFSQKPHKALLVQFQDASRLKDQVTIVEKILKLIDKRPQDIEAKDVTTLVWKIEASASKCRKLQSSQALELLLTSDDIRARYEDSKFEARPIAIADILRAEAIRLPTVLSTLPLAKQRRVLNRCPEAFGESWKKKVIWLAQNSCWQIVADIARIFEHHDALHAFQKAISASVAERSVSQEILYWICKERGGQFLLTLFNVDLLNAILIVLERDRLCDGKSRSSRLHNLLLEDKTLLQDLLANASRQSVRDFVRRLLLSPAFEDVNRRLLLARIIKLHPEMQNIVQEKVESQQTSSQAALTVSWTSLERRKAEYDELVTRQLTQSVKDIATARSYGDLRENLEFKYAKEQYAVLIRRKAELELMLANARGTNFESPDISKVSIGTVVNIIAMVSGHTETYSILGAWDGIPSQNVVSYQTAIGRTLLGKSVGDMVDIRDSSGRLQQWRVNTIQPFKNFKLLSSMK